MPADFTLAEVAGMLRKLGKKIHQRHWPHECACDEMAGHLPDCLNAAARTMAAALEAMEPVGYRCPNHGIRPSGEVYMRTATTSTCAFCFCLCEPLYSFRADAALARKKERE
jgi:hypothetical protein